MLVNKQMRRNSGNSPKPVGCKRTAATKKRVLKTKTRLAITAPPALIGLPRIPAYIPSELVFPVNSQESAKVALTMLDAGLLTEADIQDGNRHPVALVEKSFCRWADNIAAPLTIFDLHFNLTDSVERWGYGFDDDRAREVKNLEDRNAILIGASYGSWWLIYLKEKVEAVEAVAPGLGKTALDMLFSVIHSSMFAVTPHFLMDEARHVYWGGMDSEAEYIEEYGLGADDADIEAMKAEMVTLAEVEKILPALEPPTLDTAAIDALTKHGDPLVSSLAALLMQKDGDDGYDRPTHVDEISEDGTVCSDPAVWLQWQEEDMSSRIADDWYEYVSQVGTSSINVFWMCELSPDKVSDCFANIDRYVKRLLWSEQIIKLLGTVVNN